MEASKTNGIVNNQSDMMVNGNATLGPNGQTNGHQTVTTNGNTNGTTSESSIAVETAPNPAKQVPVAICGMGVRLPGGIRKDADLYDFLINKKDARSVTGNDRFNVESFYSPHSKHGTIITKHGYYLEDIDYSKFDAAMFTMTPAEVEQLDPNQRLVLEITREALESAGETGWRGKNIGTYVGVFSEDWHDIKARDSNDYGPYHTSGRLDFAIANRISYDMNIKTACSATGVCLHQALSAIRQGECSAAIVAGVNLILAPGMSIGMSVQMTLSPEGSSKTFDASADGYARGEGVTALYIKRLDHAIRDGNPIRAVIRASATNADGKTPGFAMPSPEAHEAAIRQAYAAADLDMGQTAMIEAHGTGTVVGDPLEVKAIAKCFGEKGIYLGAVKPNLGHGEGAATNTSIMKAVLSLENGTIIPNIKFNTPNPAIPWKEAKLVVPVEVMPWPEDRAERMSVNSYGIGGSNTHFVIDSAASFGLAAKARPVSNSRQALRLLLSSAHHPDSLNQATENYVEYIRKHPDRIDDLAYTLACRREHLRFRSFAVTDGLNPIAFSGQSRCNGPSRVAFVFTGQGAQWIHMGRELMADHPSFLEDIKYADQVLQDLKQAPAWAIEDILRDSEDSLLLGKAEYSQPICTALQIALVNLLSVWGVKPSSVVGHSSGEIGAAYAAGALTAKEALIVAYYRGFVCRNPEKTGGMAAIGIGRTEVDQYLVPGVLVACENSGSSVTLSGDMEALETVMCKTKANMPDVLVRKLQVEMAYHSSHMKDYGHSYREYISSHLSPRTPRIPFYSSVTTKLLTSSADFGPEYWQGNLENQVLFHSAVTSLVTENESISVHLEVGPHSALAGPLRQIYKELSSPTKYISTMLRSRNDTEVFLEAIGQLHSAGVTISFPYRPEQATVLTDLAPYPWHYDHSYWSETRVMKDWRFRKHLPHDLLGLRILEGTDLAPCWRNYLRIMDVPWLRDHCVGKDIIFPAAGYITIAGEAIFQINGDRAYTVRDISLSQAMVLNPDKTTEIITSLRPQRLTISKDSDWFEFEIVSHDGVSWNKHCVGLVRCGRASAGPSLKTEIYTRKVSTPRWYTTMARVGLNYGPRFTGLRDMTASITENKATADITDIQEQTESLYSLHPATLDLVLQTWGVASIKGVYRKFNKLYLPTFIEELYVGPGTGRDIRVNTTAVGKYKDFAQGHSYGISDGELIFYLKGFKGSPLEDGAVEMPTELTTLQLQWKPDFDFMPAAQILKPEYDVSEQVAMLETLYVLCAIESKNALQGATVVGPHFQKYISWLEDQYEVWSEPGYPLVADTCELVKLSSKERIDLIDAIVDKNQNTSVHKVVTAFARTHKEARNVVEGRTDFLDLLLQDGVLSGIYTWMNDLWDYKDYFQLLGNSQPQLRVLEIGAGTGGLTSKILESLQSDFGERLYFKYTFTDISSGFFIQAKERFADYAGMDFRVLDISKDPLEHGFLAGEYDLIIASNVLHATPYLHETLANVRKLLQPKGQLFLQELAPTARCMGYIMGMFSGWWLGEVDGRFGGPMVTPDIWHAKLLEAGFSGCDSVTYDNPRPFQMNANIVAKPAVSFEFPENVSLLSGAQIHPFAMDTQKVLENAGYNVQHFTWGQELPPDQDLISFVDLEKPLFRDISAADLEVFLRLVDVLQMSSVLWLTPPAQILPSDPHAAQILGLARTIRSELAMMFTTLELEDTESGAANAIVQILRKNQASKDDTNDLDPDCEYAWANGVINISRFHWVPLTQSLAETSATPNAKGLVIGRRGLLGTLHWTGQVLGDPDPDSVQLKMLAVGMNFHDLMIALGLLHSIEALGKGYNAFGLEGTGLVTKIGSNVTHLKVGDRAMMIGTNSASLATEIHRPALFCVKIPDELSDIDGATIPAVYVTVLLCWMDMIHIRKDQSVLIHSAAGGVGIAAIHIARMIGCEIFATVGTEEKVAFLMNEFGIPRNRIFSSRDTSFVDGIMNATDGAGVDVVLNSVSGELLHATWRCVASRGTMIDIGKRDMIGSGKLEMSHFEWNRKFIGVDLSRYTVYNKPDVERMMKTMYDLYIEGHIKPISPTTVFEAQNIEDAFRYMQKGVHMGKIVIKFPEDPETLPLTPTAPDPSFRDDVSYLLVGGMGGLGQSIAAWMVENGAKHLILLSRSAGKSEEDKAFFVELNEAGCSVQCFPCDITDEPAVRSAISQASMPIAGIMQMAMVLRDVGVMDMDIETWNAAIQPKVTGTWNVHNLAPKELDFFVLFSSSCGLMGYYGQANYAAANTFMDAFVQYRQRKGLACSVMDIGAVDDVGFVSRTPQAKENMLANAGRLMTEQNFLDSLQLVIARSSPKYAPPPSTRIGGFMNPGQVAQMLESRLPIMDPQNTILWKRDPRLGIYRNIENVATEGGLDAGDVLKAFLATMLTSPSKLEEKTSVTLLAQEIANRVSTFLMRGDDDMDLSHTLAIAGVDSLVAIELRNWWKQNLGVDVSVLELMNGGSFMQLGELAAQRLKDKFEGKGKKV
ncbi:hypothetical protein VTL71DRAFT_3024 [Oculimacula yallundae]|uniref:Polyketide synthase n=1 Tax=Oculimacula yallundae TaxID=86028 RepID=A0ABR4C610_9HELO